MEFEEFLKQLNSSINPDKAYKLFLQVKINILQELISVNTGIKIETIDNIEKKVFNALIEKMK